MKDMLAGMTAFVTVADKRSFTSAGVELGVTGSAVSQTVRQLEERLGVRLLHRTTRSVGLTEAGERLYAQMKPAFTQMHAAVESLNDLRERPAGTLRLTVPRGLTPFTREPLLAEFLAQYPEISVEVSFDDGLVDIVAEGFDAGIRLGERLEKDMIAVDVFGPERLVVVGSPAYFARRRKPKHPRDLLDHDCIDYRHVTSGARYRWEFDEDGKPFEIEVKGRVTTNDPAHMARLAVDGVGLAIMMEEYVRPFLKEGQLVRVLEPYCSPFPGFHLYHSSRVQTPLKLRVLIDFLLERRRRKKSKRS
ncbi:Transcriptional regulator, LysR family protein [Minicystis rosea]|nr:Transcriptional regulator, LysR family protein [Minicystis rosea]